MRSIVSVPVRRAGSQADGQNASDQDLLAVEEPLQIRLGDRDLAITMRTPGNDEELAAGFLFTEGILSGREAIESISVGDNSVTVKLAGEASVDLSSQQRHFYLTSSCGVCGKASLDSIAVRCAPVAAGPALAETVVVALPDRLREAQRVFDRTGGLHAAGLFDTAGTLLELREDVGRHNAVDKLVGHALLAGELPLSERVLMVSGRLSFEIVQKAAVAGIPIVCAVSAPSSLAVDAGRRFGMTLVGFLRGRRFNIYTHPERITAE
jgi:FdhD protein